MFVLHIYLRSITISHFPVKLKTKTSPHNWLGIVAFLFQATLKIRTIYLCATETRPTGWCKTSNDMLRYFPILYTMQIAFVGAKVPHRNSKRTGHVLYTFIYSWLCITKDEIRIMLIKSLPDSLYMFQLKQHLTVIFVKC